MTIIYLFVFDFLQGALRCLNIWWLGRAQSSLMIFQPIVNLYMICFVISNFIYTEVHASQIKIIKKQKSKPLNKRQRCIYFWASWSSQLVCMFPCMLLMVIGYMVFDLNWGSQPTWVTENYLNLDQSSLI
jgi:hypothetical protein